MDSNNSVRQPSAPDTKVETKSYLDKLADVFLPEDLNSIGSRIYSQVIIPTILKTAVDMLHRSIDMIFGTNYTGAPSPKPQNDAASTWTTYRQPSPNNAPAQPQGTMQIFPVRSGVYDYSIVRFKTIERTQQVLNDMRAVIQNNGFCTVARYMEFAGAKPIAEDYNYGWTDLSNVNVEENKSNEYPYRIIFPATVPTYRQNQNRYFTL